MVYLLQVQHGPVLQLYFESRSSWRIEWHQACEISSNLEFSKYRGILVLLHFVQYNVYTADVYQLVL